MSATAAQHAPAVVMAAPTIQQPQYTTTYTGAVPSVTYASTPAVTYASATPGVTYAAPQQMAYTIDPATGAYMLPPIQAGTTIQQAGTTTYTGATTYTVAPTVTSSVTGEAAALAQPVIQSAGSILQPAASMVAYPGVGVPTIGAQPTFYMALSIKQAWENHFDAFGKQDLDKIMLDYDETSVARLYNFTSGQKSEYRGLAQIRGMFQSLFADLRDLSTLDAPIVDVEEDMRQVFLCWRCIGMGYKTATDTFIFGPDFKIKRQNIVITKEDPSVSPTASGSHKASSSKVSSEKKVSSKKVSSKKKSKGIC